MKNKIFFVLLALTFLLGSSAQADEDMKESEALGNSAVANYKNPEINPVEVGGLGLQLFLVDLWKFEPDKSKGNNAY